jgi:Xaa-Pro aminopeptidase
MTNIASRGATMAVDWEQRIDFPKLRRDRLQRAQQALRESDLGALLLFDPNNIRYVTSTHIGEWARDKNARYALLPREGDPVLWDFGSAARHHQLYAPWLPPESFRAGVTPMRGAMPEETGVPQALAERIALELHERGVAGDPLGIDMSDLTSLAALGRKGIQTVDGSQVILTARAIKTDEEVALLDHAAAIVDATYEEIYRMLRPGITEREVVARAQALLFELGSEQVEAINAVSGDRCNPHPHVFSDRLLRPGDQAFFDIIHSFMGYRTCYYRTFSIGHTNQAQLDAYKQCREWLDLAIERVRPGAMTADIARVWPAATELGFPDEESCFGLQFGHGLGVGLYEPPMISRLHSLDRPAEIKQGMVFALETYCPARDGISAARIEEEVLVTADGCRVLTRFPAHELLVAGRTYVRGADLSDAAVRSDTAATADGQPGLAPTRREPGGTSTSSVSSS